MMRIRANLLTLIAGLLLTGCAAKSPARDPAFAVDGTPDTRPHVAPAVIEAEAEKEFKEARRLLAEMKYAEAERRLVPLARRYDSIGRPARAAEAMFWSAYCNERQGLTPDARALYLRVINDYPQTPAARQAAGRLTRLPAE
jgi:TolA-binding protein